jgi:hypothetical protein
MWGSCPGRYVVEVYILLAIVGIIAGIGWGIALLEERTQNDAPAVVTTKAGAG